MHINEDKSNLARVSMQLVWLILRVLYVVTEGHSKYLTHVSPGHSQWEQSPVQSYGSPWVGQMLTLRLLDTAIQGVLVMTSRRLGRWVGVGGGWGIIYKPVEKYFNILMHCSVYRLNSSPVFTISCSSLHRLLGLRERKKAEIPPLCFGIAL